ncbi:hypothetical protein ACH4Y0_34285 [Streptomyces sp. NPDC020707]|uniref:hypothetical protein n=1 Tax=Streptomyces sp. NPDC020707 TaxID=3365084 RepID=UPI0037A59E67
MATTMQKAVAVGGALTTTATGIVTNQITDEWSWTWGATLAVLVAAGIWLAILALGGSSPTVRAQHRARADHHGRIDNSGAIGREGAVIEQTATRGGAITDSPVTAHGADIDQSTDHGGQITGSPSDIR